MATTQRRNYGSGSLVQKEDSNGNPIPNKWLIRISWQDSEGKRQRKAETVSGNKTKAKKRLEELKAELESGVNLEGGETTFAQFARDWQQRREAAQEVGTSELRASNYAIEQACPFIGGMKLKEINAETVESLRAQIRESKRKPDGTTVQPRTLARYESFYKQIFKAAYNYDYITRNPYDRAAKIRQKEPERRALSAVDTARLYKKLDEAEAAAKQEYQEKEQRQQSWRADKRREGVRGLKQLSCLIAVRLGLATGARRGEILGLTWGEIYPDGHIRIAKSLEHVTYGADKGKLNLKEPKSEAGKREVCLDPETMEHLRKWRELQSRELQKIGALPEGLPRKDTPVCCSNTGGFIDPNNFGHWWSAWRDKNGFKGLLFHELRHTQATRLLMAGVDVKTVQKRLGHSSPLITMGVYTHAEAAEERKAALMMGAILKGETGNVIQLPEMQKAASQ